MRNIRKIKKGVFVSKSNLSKKIKSNNNIFNKAKINYIDIDVILINTTDITQMVNINRNLYKTNLKTLSQMQLNYINKKNRIFEINHNSLERCKDRIIINNLGENLELDIGEYTIQYIMNDLEVFKDNIKIIFE